MAAALCEGSAEEGVAALLDSLDAGGDLARVALAGLLAANCSEGGTSKMEIFTAFTNSTELQSSATVMR